MFPKSIQPSLKAICEKALLDKSFDQVMQLKVYNVIAEQINLELMQYKEYKWIVHVNTQQLSTMLMTSQCIWDQERDGLIEYIHKTNEFVIGIVVYGCFYRSEE